ncbi:hypothetical protein EB118_24840 [bacterium]|nr:hypothetical protein [bacterium]NDD85103.1 hypothetical protein [bacterium]NDG33281.1 hypothetical protein [bacterium]
MDIWSISDPNQLKLLCTKSKKVFHFCKQNSIAMAKNILEKNNIDYTDPNCPIYNQLDISNYIKNDGTYNLKEIFKKYARDTGVTQVGSGKLAKSRQPAKCPICFKLLNRPSDVSKHLKTVHRNDITAQQILDLDKWYRQSIDDNFFGIKKQ